MFDNLRDKLQDFRSDVGETAEEEAEPIDEEAEAEDEAIEDADAADEIAEPEAEGIDGRMAAVDASAETDSDTAGNADTDPAVETDPAPDADDAEDPDLSLGRRARSFVTGRVVLDEEDLEGPLWELEMALLESDVEMSVAQTITDRLEAELVGETRTMLTRTGSVVTEALREALLEVLAVGQFDLLDELETAEKPVVVLFTGVNGVGKTTSIAKVARYLGEHGFSTVLANGDTYRAGANEQIAEHAERLDRDLISHDQGGDPAAVLYDAREYAEAHDIDVVLADTAGRLHTSQGLMDQLDKIGRVVEPEITLFVDEAVAGQDAVNRAREFDEAIPIDGTVLTKADADTKGGAAISIAHVTGKPILFLGTGQGYDDLERFDPERMVERLLDGE